MEPNTQPLDDDNVHTVALHTAIAALLDPFSIARTFDLVDLRAKRCLDVGAGGGSFAHFLANEVGPHGSVVATDLKPCGIPQHPRLTVLPFDVTNDPVPGVFDYIHARLVLGHISGRREILKRLIRALALGGVLLIEDWDTSRTDMVLHAPSLEAAEIYTAFQEILGGKPFEAAGTDRTWARRIHGAMLDEGLTDVQTVMHAQAWPGGSAGCQVIQATLRRWVGRRGHETESRDKLRHAGLAENHLRQVRSLLDDPRLVLAGHLLYSTSGRRGEAGKPEPFTIRGGTRLPW